MGMFCKKCGTMLVRKTLNGGTVLYCPKCGIDVSKEALGEGEKIIAHAAEKKIFMQLRTDDEKDNQPERNKDKG